MNQQNPFFAYANFSSMAQYSQLMTSEQTYANAVNMAQYNQSTSWQQAHANLANMAQYNPAINLEQAHANLATMAQYRQFHTLQQAYANHLNQCNMATTTPPQVLDQRNAFVTFPQMTARNRLYENQVKIYRINQVVEHEMLRQHNLFVEEELNFMKGKFDENPVRLQRRIGPLSKHIADERDPEQIMELLKRKQRAESCRQSRITNKLKGATELYRDQFLLQKIEQLRKAHTEMMEKIKSTEQRLLNRGHNPWRLEELRTLCGYKDVEFPEVKPPKPPTVTLEDVMDTDE
ncbi:uncharacterized protein LOC129252919 [Anastrepha obliqua]|uniref:uncharacterized protein LOC129252919 n=1 Tax=Anastrepha obliqua TaxID=95512 RepID=UPI00240A7051|nr:uncharacterized protein LOC129252919 [Anastrepha obliqua]